MAPWAESESRAEGHLKSEVLIASPHAHDFTLNHRRSFLFSLPAPHEEEKERGAAWKGHGLAAAASCSAEGGFTGLEMQTPLRPHSANVSVRESSAKQTLNKAKLSQFLLQISFVCHHRRSPFFS